MNELDDSIEIGNVDKLPPLVNVSNENASSSVDSKVKKQKKKKPKNKVKTIPLEDILLEKMKKEEKAKENSKRKGKKQKKIFDFAKVDNEKYDEDQTYQIILKIFYYFNRKKPIPTILAAIHAVAGDVKKAIQLLADDSYTVNSDDIEFSFSTIQVESQDEITEYFR